MVDQLLMADNDIIIGNKRLILNSVTWYFTGCKYYSFNNAIKYNDKYYILVEITTNQQPCKLHNNIGYCYIFDIDSLQFSILLCLYNDTVEWFKHISLNIGDVRAYGLRIKDQLYQISGSLSYISPDKFNNHLPIPHHDGIYGFIASCNKHSWLHITYHHSGNVTDLYNGDGFIYNDLNKGIVYNTLNTDIIMYHTSYVKYYLIHDYLLIVDKLCLIINYLPNKEKYTINNGNYKAHRLLKQHLLIDLDNKIADVTYSNQQIKTIIYELPTGNNFWTYTLDSLNNHNYQIQGSKIRVRFGKSN